MTVNTVFDARVASAIAATSIDGSASCVGPPKTTSVPTSRRPACLGSSW